MKYRLFKKPPPRRSDASFRTAPEQPRPWLSGCSLSGEPEHREPCWSRFRRCVWCGASLPGQKITALPFR